MRSSGRKRAERRNLLEPSLKSKFRGIRKTSLAWACILFAIGKRQVAPEPHERLRENHCAPRCWIFARPNK